MISFGNYRGKPAADAIVAPVISEGALVSPKSKLTPLNCIDWIGKQFRFGEGVISGSTTKWSALLAWWLLFSVSYCLCKDLLRLVGRVLWDVRPSWGVPSFLASTWAHILWAPICLKHTPSRLLHALVTPIVMAARNWVVRVLRSPSTRRPTQVFFDGGPDANGWRVGLWAPGLGGRSSLVPDSFCNQQVVEMQALEFTTNLIRAVGWPAASAVGDNSAVLKMFVNAKAGVGLSTQNRVLRRLVYNWSVAHTSLFLCWVPSEYNPADPWSRLTDDCCGDEALAAKCSETIYGRLRNLGTHAVKKKMPLGVVRDNPPP